MNIQAQLEQAWSWRQTMGIFRGDAQALRVFHGPGEGRGGLEWFAIDQFGKNYWVTEWENLGKGPRNGDLIRKEIILFLQKKEAKSVVGLSRPAKGIAPESELWLGEMPTGHWEVQEAQLKFQIQFEKTRHPGLFLDHEPLRRWLSTRCQGMTVLNGFAYTGSLSVAAAAGGAKKVTTLDLSKVYINWAKENFSLNGFSEADHRFIAGDVFEWLPRLKREKEQYDCVILDPPSFSHGNKGRFSTAKDLEKLHSLALDVLAPQGILVTSINSSNISWAKYEAEILAASKGRAWKILRQIDLPETFPTPLGQASDRYLKGWVLQKT